MKDCVFGGGVSKETTDRAGRYFKLNIEKRIADIIALSHKTDAFREEIAMAIKLFADIYLGHRAFNYEECNQATKSLMELLAQDFPDVYSGITDPLSAMHDIVIKQSHANTVDAEDTSVDNEAAFKDWLARLPKANGDLYSENTRNQYISALLPLFLRLLMWRPLRELLLPLKVMLHMKSSTVAVAMAPYPQDSICIVVFWKNGIQMMG